MIETHKTKAELLIELEQLRQRVAELEALEERTRIVSELTSDYSYSFAVHADGTVENEWITDAFTRITGYTPAEMVHLGWEHFRHPDDVARAQARMAQHLKGESTATEFRLITKKGEIKWVQDYALPIWDSEEKRTVRVIGATKDITPHKHAMQALAESEERYRTLIDSLPDIVIVADYDGRVLYANRALVRQTGYTLEDLQQRREEATHIYPDDRQRIWQAIRAFLESERQYSDPIENRLIDKWGNVHWYTGTLTKIHYHGQPAMQTISRDITKQRLAEQERLALAEERERRETLQTLIGSISHDLKTPLAVINSRLYALEHHPDPGARHRFVDIIKDQVSTLDHFIQDLLTLSRLEGDPELHLTALDLNSQITTIHQEFESVAEIKHLTFDFRAEKNLPSVQADEMLLRRAFTNLIENALHYTPDGGTVTIRTARQTDDVIVEVSDTGIGISAQELPHVFERFYRAGEAQALRHSGTGLGLAIVKRATEQHGGSVEVESQPGNGSTFRIRLPYA